MKFMYLLVCFSFVFGQNLEFGDTLKTWNKFEKGHFGAYEDIYIGYETIDNDTLKLVYYKECETFFEMQMNANYFLIREDFNDSTFRLTGIPHKDSLKNTNISGPVILFMEAYLVVEKESLSSDKLLFIQQLFDQKNIPVYFSVFEEVELSCYGTKLYSFKQYPACMSYYSTPPPPPPPPPAELEIIEYPEGIECIPPPEVKKIDRSKDR